MYIEIRRIDGSDRGVLVAMAEKFNQQNKPRPRMNNESQLLYHVKQALIKAGYDVIKKRMWKDGHLVDDLQQYICTRYQKALWRKNPEAEKDAFYVFDEYWAVRNSAQEWNKTGRVEFTMLFDVFGGDKITVSQPKKEEEFRA